MFNADFPRRQTPAPKAINFMEVDTYAKMILNQSMFFGGKILDFCFSKFYSVYANENSALD